MILKYILFTSINISNLKEVNTFMQDVDSIVLDDVLLKHDKFKKKADKKKKKKKDRESKMTDVDKAVKKEVKKIAKAKNKKESVNKVVEPEDGFVFKMM